ncbi:MAG: T9SS type A sorting domain-containing protein [Bacteroidales bacterium]
MTYLALPKILFNKKNAASLSNSKPFIVNKIFKAFLSLAFLLIATGVSAQYTGGIGSGYDMAEMDCVVPPPVISSNTPVCDNATLTLEAIGEGSFVYPPEALYEWTGPGGWTSSDAAPERTPAVAGDYFLTVSIIGCGESMESSHTVETLESPTVTLVAETDTEICEGGEVFFQAIPDAPEFKWYKDDVEIPGEDGGTYVATEAGVYYVVAINTNGCSTASSTEEVIVNDLPVVSIAANGDTEFCDGGSVEIEATATGSGALLYQWYEETTGILDGETNSTFIAEESGSYYVAVTDENLCEQDSESIEVNVFPLPEVFITPDGVISFCEDETVEVLFEATAGFETYQWYQDDVEIPGAESETYLATEAGEYYVVVSDVNTCVNSSDPAVVEVNTLPDVTISHEDDAFICEGEELLLNATEGFEAYEWYKDDVLIDGEDGSTYAASEEGSYYVIVTDINGCTNMSNVIDVFVNPLPEPEIFADTENLDFCEGDDIEVLMEVVSNDFYESFQWYKDDVEIPGADTETYLATEAGSYYALVTDVNGCSAISNILEINIHPLPLVEITTSGEIEFCSQELNAVPDTYTWYEWYLDGDIIEDENDPTLIARFSGEYVVLATDDNQCVGASDPIVLDLPDRPNADAGEDQTIDYDTSTTLAADDGGAGSYEYSWEPADLLVDPNVQNPTTVNLTETTTFTLMVLDLDTQCDNFDEVTVFVNPQTFNLTVDINPAGGGSVEVMVDDVVLTEPYEIEVDKEVVLTATAEDNYEFEHFLIGSDEFTDNPYTFIITEDTDVTAVFEFINNIVELTGEDISVYPNPARDLINFSWENADKSVSISIVNSTGQVVKRIENTNTQGSLSEQIDISGWQKGLYFIRIASEKGIITKSFIIQ